jgi:hypothetical protein
MSLSKLLSDLKFLDKVKQAALSHKDDAVPDKDGQYYQAMMWSRGTIDILKSHGYKIEKDNGNPA